MQGATANVGNGLVPPAAKALEKKPRKSAGKQDGEMLAMGRIERLLAGLTPAAGCRVLDWAISRQRDRVTREMAARSHVQPSKEELSAVLAPLDTGKY